LLISFFLLILPYIEWLFGNGGNGGFGGEGGGGSTAIRSFFGLLERGEGAGVGAVLPAVIS